MTYIFLTETGCNSWHGRKYVKCPNSHKCVENIARDCVDFIDEGGGGDPKANLDKDPGPATTCPPNPLTGRLQWRCNDGLCIERNTVCDATKNCADGSDETDGCKLYPSTNCSSWFGRRHEQCIVNGTAVCTLAEYAAKNECRRCEDDDEWRCNSGWCIDKEKVFDGIPHCKDGSDEHICKLNFIIVLFLKFV